MNKLKRRQQWHMTPLILLAVGFVLPVSAQSQKLELLTVTAKGHGEISSAVDERKITSALVLLRETARS
jgi:hypothetical protein